MYKNKLVILYKKLYDITMFFPISSLMALSFMYIMNLTTFNQSIFNNLSESFFLWFIAGFYIFIWASIHKFSLYRKGVYFMYGIATLVWCYLGFEIFYAEYTKEIIFFKSIFITLAFILSYSYVPFLKKRGNNIHILAYLHHAVYAFIGSFIYIFLYTLAITIISITLSSLFSINTVHITSITNNIILGIFFYMFNTSMMIDPHSNNLNVQQYNLNNNSSFFNFIYPFTISIFTILNIYVLKIIITQELPNGQIAWMVVIFSVFAFLSYFSFVPYKNKIKKYNSWIWGTLILQSFILLGSIGIRIYTYGMTEKRYLLLAYGLWLFGISIYFLITKTKAKIFYFFSTLSIVVFLSQIGPLNGYIMSKSSQQHRFIMLLKTYQKEAGDRESSTFIELNNIYKYLYQTHNRSSIQSLFPQTKEKEIDSLSKLLSILNIHQTTKKVDKKSKTDKPHMITYEKYNNHTPYNIKGYDYFFHNQHKSNDLTELKFGINESISFLEKNQKIDITVGKDKFIFDFTRILKHFSFLKYPGNVDKKYMSMVKENKNYKIKIIFSSLTIDTGSNTISDFYLDIYIKPFDK